MTDDPAAGAHNSASSATRRCGFAILAAVSNRQALTDEILPHDGLSESNHFMGEL
jgi:hypothetical protein